MDEGKTNYMRYRNEIRLCMPANEACQYVRQVDKRKRVEMALGKEGNANVRPTSAKNLNQTSFE